MTKKGKESIEKEAKVVDIYSDEGMKKEMSKQAFGGNIVGRSVADDLITSVDEQMAKDMPDPDNVITISKYDSVYAVELMGFNAPSEVLACLDNAKKQLVLSIGRGTFNGEGVL